MTPAAYTERKLATQCTYPGCDVAPDDDCNECSTHREASRIRRHKYRVKKRREWERARLCLRCGGKRKQGRKWCLVCLIREDRAREIAADKQRDESASSETAWRNDPGTNWRRYRGKGRRGRLTAEESWGEHERDIDEAIAQLQECKRRGRAYVYGGGRDLPLVQRQEARSLVAEPAGRASRIADELEDAWSGK